ncbi:MAG TPA: T9SS type A sorting domain-containing protein [Saprospiraceae bacterium]|jgi:hypothetical protein|nr:T9SS type A sorting domain-containing protein [Saprospiraceae bacterium]HMT72208.1 T9SS type A sorting domain-containing protein [Saprospiraceae bacterium]
MRILIAVLFICSIYSDLFSQDLVAWAPSTNNLTEGQSLSHTNLGVGATIGIVDDGNDGVSNIQVLIFDNINVLQEIVSWPSNPDGYVPTGWKAEYHALTGQGSSCTNGGKDWFFIDDNNNNSYSNPDHCVKLGTLPVRYQNQPTAKREDDQSHISWSVSTQINNEKFIIEHSKDGRNFSSIGEIAGDGTNNETKHYEYIHASPAIGINYYRIKQVDYDGKYSYSDIASVRYEGDNKTNIYPNPAISEVTITTSEQTTLQIMDVYGRLLNKQDISEGQNTINLSEFPTGILIFVVGNQRYKVLKE